jgi:hypothetical protein
MSICFAHGKTADRRMEMKSRRGSSAIFLVFILCGIFGVVFAFLAMARQIAQVAAVDSAMALGGRSVLSEYDPCLKEHYGLFAFRGQQEDINAKMKRYVHATLSSHSWLGEVKITSDTSEYALSNIDSFEEEILEYVRYALAENLLKDKVDAAGGGEGQLLDTKESGRCIGNKGVAETLPSGGVVGSGDLFDRLRYFRDGSSALKKSSAGFLVNRYIMEYFKNAQQQELAHDTFFKYEVEYILCGHLDDDENRKDVRRRLKLVRNGVALLYLYTDQKKMSQLTTAAETLTPGPAAVVTQLALAEAWALAEAENDMRLLEHGYKVPLEKTDATWAVELENIVKKKPEKFIPMDSERGFTYQGYLQMLLFLESRDRKYGRMMDLMQINIQGLWDSTFLMREHNTGFHVEGTVGGKKYRYDNEY